MSVITIYTVFVDKEEAERIGRQMIDERLAACVNILAPCTSIYRWDGVVEKAEEVPALFKTRTDLADRLVERVAHLHSYDVPAVVAWPIDRLFARYGDWVESATRYYFTRPESPAFA